MSGPSTPCIAPLSPVWQGRSEATFRVPIPEAEKSLACANVSVPVLAPILMPRLTLDVDDITSGQLSLLSLFVNFQVFLKSRLQRFCALIALPLLFYYALPPRCLPLSTHTFTTLHSTYSWRAPRMPRRSGARPPRHTNRLTALRISWTMLYTR